jgi:glycine oxidase
LDETGVAARVEPVRGQILFYKTQKGLLGRMLKWKQKYLVPRLDGHVLAGSTVEYVGFNKETTQEAVDMIHQAAVEMMPVLKDCPISHRWAGLRPGIPDSIPLIGPHPEIEGLYFNTGHFRNGMVCSLASARLLADMMTGRPPILEPAPYRPIKK